MRPIGEMLQGLYIRMNAPSMKEKTNFFRLLALSQKAGIGVRDSLISIRKTEKQPGLMYVIDDIIDQLNQGANFSGTLSKHPYVFQPEEIALINAAEAIGNMPEILEEVSEELENDDKINQRIKKAITYPMILLTFALVAVVVLLLFVIPTIVGMFPSREALPSITVFMLDASDFMKKYYVYLFLGAFGIYFGYVSLYSFVLPFKIFIDLLLLKIPVLADVVKTFYMYRYSKLLGQLYNGGINPIVALQLINNVVSNFHYKKKIMEIENDMKSGFGMAESMEGSWLFDPILIQIIQVGETTGYMGNVLRKVAVFYRDMLQNKIDLLLALIEPILMVFIASIIGSVVGAIFIPMADMINVMG